MKVNLWGPCLATLFTPAQKNLVGGGSYAIMLSSTVDSNSDAESFHLSEGGQSDRG